jgi:hypothetical protein
MHWQAVDVIRQVAIEMDIVHRMKRGWTTLTELDIRLHNYYCTALHFHTIQQCFPAGFREKSCNKYIKERPRKITNITRNIAGIFVRQLAILE